MKFIYNNLKKFIYVVTVLMITYLSFVSCAKESYFEIADMESRYPVDVEISGYVYDKDTNLPITGRQIEIVLEVFLNKADVSPIQVEKTVTDEDDGTFTAEVAAMAPFLRLTVLGAHSYTDGSIEYYITPGGGPSGKDFSEFKAENQIIYLGKR